ncbi:MAG TPA: DUF6597 domain-containing transcriptional factor [Polyangiaceae bacterium]|nr:DUF6597 domain-containing transcriptional factor [Polyangiaceae bacterium]
MIYQERPPSPSLRSLVACFWSISGERDGHRVLPDGAMDIVVIDGVARVVGAMTRAEIVPGGTGPVFGVRFRPGEAVRILAEAAELTDVDAPLAEIWREGPREIEDERALERAVIARLSSHGAAADVRVRAAIDVLASGGSVRQAAERAGLSERQLARRFTPRVGVGPKLFARVMRLQRAAGVLARGAPPLAASTHAGYADQAHFTRDARELAGATPSVLASEMFKTPVAFAG